MHTKFRFRINKSVRDQLGLELGKNGVKQGSPKLIEDVRKDFAAHTPEKVRAAILSDVTKGISPVRSKGRFKKYSASYLAQIKGLLDFRTIGGKVVTIRPKKGKKLNTWPRQHGKSVSPINLKVTGELHDALDVGHNGLFKPSERFMLVIKWKHFLADIHNHRGAGKSKVVRRLLPTRNGEQFNMTISRLIYNQLKKSVERVVNRLQ